MIGLPERRRRTWRGRPEEAATESAAIGRSSLPAAFAAGKHPQPRIRFGTVKGGPFLPSRWSGPVLPSLRDACGAP